MAVPKTKPLFLAMALTLLLAGCGGGDDDGVTTAPAAPVLDPVTYDIRQLEFSWPAVTGADYYRLLENPDGASGFSEVATNITALTYEHDISVHLQDWVNASYMLQACNSQGCTDSAAVTATDSAGPIGYFKASNTGSNDQFGFAVAISGDGSTLAIGANLEDSNTTGIDSTPNDDGGANESGAVYVFALDNGSWVQQAYIKAPNTDAADRFGESVALSQDGNTLVIGAEREDGSVAGIFAPTDGGYGAAIGDDGAAEAGAAYVYSRSASTWSLQAYIKASNAETNDRFGQDVALSADGNTLAVGANGEASNATGVPAEPAPGTDNDGASGAGAAYVFTRSGSTWSQQAYVKASNTEADDNFGYKLALSDDGDTLAVAAIWEDSTSTGIGGNQANDPQTTTNAGATYVFTRTLGNWSQEEYIKASTVDAGDNFGSALALSSDGNTLAVGANHEDSNAVTINGDETDNTETDSGAGYVFTRSGTAWTQEAYLKASNGEQFVDGDEFGYALALSNDGNRLIVTAWDEDSSATGIDGNQALNGAEGAGAAYFFTRSGATWTQDAYVKASNSGAGDQYGVAVDVDDTADILLLGAFGEDSDATGVGGDQGSGAAISGAGYLY